MRTGTAARMGATLLVAVGVLTACSGSEPKAGRVTVTPSPTSASATSPSPSATTPEQQIEAAMARYFEVTNEAFKTGDVAELRAFSTSACPCRRATNTIATTIASGGHFEGIQYNVISIRVHNVAAETAAAEVKASLPPYKVFNGAGEVTENSKGGQLHTDYSLVRSGDRWIIGNAIDLR